MTGALIVVLVAVGIAAAWAFCLTRSDRRHAREMHRAGRSVAFLQERVAQERIYEQPTEVLPVATRDPSPAPLPHRVPSRIRPYVQQPPHSGVDPKVLQRVLTGLQNLSDTEAPPEYPKTDPDAC